MMKPAARFGVVGVRPDGQTVLLIEEATREGAETVLRLIERTSGYSELRIVGGPESEVASGSGSVDENPSDA